MPGGLTSSTSLRRSKSKRSKHVRTGADGQQVRNELFSGPSLYRDEATQPEAALSVDQLVTKTERTHTDTTAVARRALKTVEQSKQVQAATMVELADQGNQLHRVNNELYQLNEDLTYGEKLLRYMNRWCCCCFFDRCTGADPDRNIRGQWKEDVDQGRTAARDRYYQEKNLIPEAKPDNGPLFKGTKPAARGYGGNASGLRNGEGYRDPHISLPSEHRAEEIRLHEETRKQNEMLGQIEDGLGTLMQGARRMGEEVEAQGQGLDTLHQRAETTVGRIRDVNDKSQLRKFAHEGGGRGRGYRGETNTLWQNMDDQSLANKIKFLT